MTPHLFRPLPLLLAGLLAACAPALPGTPSGRLVNSRTGDEGRVTFTAPLTSRAALPSDPDNVRIVLDGLSYSGRAVVLGDPFPLGLSVGVSAGGSIGAAGGAGTILGSSLGLGYDTRPEGGALTRPGNLIVRSAPGVGGRVRTLTCTFQVDRAMHGIGTCQDEAGVTYGLQF
jgi:hypothetical protein